MPGNYYGHDFERPPVGTSTSGMMPFDEIQRVDGKLDSPTLKDRGDYRAKPLAVPFSRYIDPDLVQREIDEIWMKTWTVACRAEDIPNVGDRTRYDMVDRSFMIVRTGEDTIKAFYNSCRHRGRRLCDGPTSDDKIQCPFHGWTWNLDGELKWIPSREDFPGQKDQALGLTEIGVELWGGNVFVNPDPDAGPLADALGPLLEHFEESPMENRFTAVRMLKKIRANWKLAQEAFMEAYHMVYTHWDALPFSGDANSLYDAWSTDDNGYCVSRVLTPLAVPSPFLAEQVSNADALAVFLKNMGYAGDVPDSNDLGELRQFAADVRRKELKAMFNVDTEDMPIGQVIDAVKYFMFPNFHPWWGEGVPLYYRFLPLSRDPNECVMEARLLMPLPPSGPRPPAAPAIEVDFDTNCADVEELAFLGYIFDQDMSNLEAVQAGIKAAPDRLAVANLARVQENPIRHFHEVYAERIGT